MIAAQPLPDYAMEELPGDLIRFSQKHAVTEPGSGFGGAAAPVLKPATLERARDLMPGADVYALEAEWQAMWARTGRPRLRQADAAFLGWVKKRGLE